jgi:hypothetical protein
MSVTFDLLVQLDVSTALFTQMQGATTIGERQSIANTYIDTNTQNGQFIRAPEQLQFGAVLQQAIASTSAANQPSVELFISTLLSTVNRPSAADIANDQAFQQDRLRLSDTLLARMHTTYPLPNLDVLQNIYRAQHLVQQIAAGATMQLPWERLLRISIVIPENVLPSMISLRRASAPAVAPIAVVAQHQPGGVERRTQRFQDPM